MLSKYELPRDLRVTLKTRYCHVVDGLPIDPGLVPLFAVRTGCEQFGAPIICPSFDDFYRIFTTLYRIYVDEMSSYYSEFCPDVYFVGTYNRDNGSFVSYEEDHQMPACVVTWKEFIADVEEGDL